MLLKSCILFALSCIPAAQAQTFKLTPQQIKAAHLDSKTAKQVEQAVNLERKDWAAGPVSADPIYSIPSNSSGLPAGSLINLEDNTKPAPYYIPLGTSLSRFTYVSENLNGTRVPASAYILWPYSARTFSNVSGIPVIALAHGSDGWHPNVAPSHLRDLAEQWEAPFTLALAGYAVVAPDYAGLGVSKDAHGKRILHQWLANPAAANDLAYSIEAAREAYPQLSRSFVAYGHSQGGGAVWAFAQRQVDKPVAGYLGSIASAPITSYETQLATIPLLESSIANALAYQLKTTFPDFEKKYYLTDLGLARAHLLDEIDAGDDVAFALFTGDITHQRWQTDTYYLAAYNKLTSNGGKAFAEPLLVIQGTADQAVNHAAQTKVVHATCSKFPHLSLTYAQFKGLGHDPVTYGSRQLWLDWIEARFNGRSAPAGCVSSLIKPLPGRDFKKVEEVV